jgi:hypothetical protein
MDSRFRGSDKGRKERYIFQSNCVMPAQAGIHTVTTEKSLRSIIDDKPYAAALILSISAPQAPSFSSRRS